jgi:hypothetical protein
VQELYETIARLPQDFRDAIVAIDVLGLSYREAARALGVREATITTRLFRARKQVAEQVAGEPPAERPGAAGTRGAGGAPERGSSQRKYEGLPPSRVTPGGEQSVHSGVLGGRKSP